MNLDSPDSRSAGITGGRLRNRTRIGATTLLGLLLALLLPACDSDGTSPEPSVVAEVGVVVNSIDLSVTLFPVDSPQAPAHVGLGPDGTPVSVAVRGDLALVPLGTVPAVAVVDLRTRTRTRTVALPEGSGATGAAFIDDTLAVAGNPERNSVSIINLATGLLGAEVETGAFPQRVLVQEGRIFVVNGELGPDFQPARTGTITVLDASTFSRIGTVELSGENPGGAAFGPDGRLYVSLSGSFGAGDGALSIIDPDGLAEISHHTGFGDFPGSVAVGDDGAVYVASFAYGVAVWDPSTESFVRGPENALTPGDVPSTSGIGLDSEGRLYALTPDCQNPATVSRLDPGTFASDVEIPVGTCPIAIAFGEVRD